eukprot:jgi/Tetstr1/427034/TSEL_017239.t1
MGTGVQNAPVDGPCHTPTSRGLESTLKAEDKAVMPTLSLTSASRATLRFLRPARGLRGDAALGSRRPPTSTVDVDEGSSPEPPAKKAEQPAKPAAGGPGGVVPGPGRAVGRSGRGPAAGPP